MQKPFLSTYPCRFIAIVFNQFLKQVFILRLKTDLNGIHSEYFCEGDFLFAYYPPTPALGLIYVREGIGYLDPTEFFKVHSQMCSVYSAEFKVAARQLNHLRLAEIEQIGPFP